MGCDEDLSAARVIFFLFSSVRTFMN